MTLLLSLLLPLIPAQEKNPANGTTPAPAPVPAPAPDPPPPPPPETDPPLPV